MHTSAKRITIAVLILAFAIAIYEGVSVLPGLYWGRHLAQDKAYLQRQVKIGDTRAQVIARLGKPWDTACSGKDFERYRTDKSYVPTPTAPLEKEVLVYVSPSVFWRAYVYIDRHNRVSLVHFART